MNRMLKTMIKCVIVSVLLLTAISGAVWAEENDNYVNALTAEPEAVNEEILMQRAQDYRAMNDLEGMIECYTRIIVMDQNNITAHIKRGVCYAETGNIPLALADFTAAAALDPQNADADIEASTVLIDAGRLQDALTKLHAAVEIESGLSAVKNTDLVTEARSARLCNVLGLLYFKMHDYDTALLAYNKAVSIDEKYSDAYNNRGVLYYTNKKYLKAVDDFSCAIENNAQDVKAYNNRGLTKRKMLDYVGAAADYTFALQLNEKYKDAWFNLATLYEIIGESQKAEIAYENYLRYADGENVDKISYAQKRLFALKVKEQQSK